MARNVKKKSPEPQLCQPAEIFAALQMLEKERGIPVDYMVDRIKQALINAYRKDREDHREVPAENVEVELTEAVMSMVQQRTVVEEVENPASEISLDAARNTSPNAQPGDVIVLAGKGHETVQEVQGVSLPLDEREVVAEYFEKRAQYRERAGNLPAGVV